MLINLDIIILMDEIIDKISTEIAPININKKQVKFSCKEDFCFIINNEYIKKNKLKSILWWSGREQLKFRNDGMFEIKNYMINHPTLSYKESILRKYKIKVVNDKNNNNKKNNSIIDSDSESNSETDTDSDSESGFNKLIENMNNFFKQKHIYNYSFITKNDEDNDNYNNQREGEENYDDDDDDNDDDNNDDDDDDNDDDNDDDDSNDDYDDNDYDNDDDDDDDNYSEDNDNYSEDNDVDYKINNEINKKE